MRNLNESDLQQLASAGIEVLAPIPRTQYPREDLLPVFTSRTATAQPAHIHFVWLGESETQAACREHWRNVIEQSIEFKDAPWLQGVLQSVDLGDMCALALEPALPVLPEDRKGASASQWLNAHVVDVSVALLRAEQCGSHLLALRPQDVLRSNTGEVQFSATAEYWWDGAGERIMLPSQVELIADYAAALAATDAELTPSVNLLRGIAAAVDSQFGSENALSHLIVALKQLQPDAGVQSGLPDQESRKESRKRSSFPAQRNGRNASLRAARGIWAVAAIVLASIVVGLYLVNMRVLDTERPERNEALALSTDENWLSVAHQVLTNRYSAFQKEPDKGAMTDVYLPETEALSDALAAQDAFMNAGASIGDLEVTVESAEFVNELEAIKGGRTVELRATYDVAYDLEVKGSTTRKQEGETVLLKITRIDDRWLIAGADVSTSDLSADGE